MLGLKQDSKISLVFWVNGSTFRYIKPGQKRKRHYTLTSDELGMSVLVYKYEN